MSDTPLKNQIISWLNDRDYWFKYAGNKLLEGKAVTDTLVAETYLLFKEENGLKKTEDGKIEIVFNKIANGDVPTKTIRLKSINNIDKVNALARKQSIEINPNLTIIYGENGTGKSGYVRLLNNAFSSRDDKKIIPNVFESRDTKEPCCNFIFQSDDSNYELEFPEKKDNIEFVQYSVFDSQSVKVHLEENNKLNFTPSGFEFFEKSIKLYEGVSQKLQEEIADKRPVNEYLKHFNNDNDIKFEITGLGVETDFEKLNIIGSYSESDEESLTEFISESKKLEVLDIPKKMAELQKLQDLLTKFTAQQKETSDLLKQENIESYKLLISLLQKNRNLVAQEGVDSLNAYQIESLSSNEWHEFIKASKSYASAIEKSRGNENEYPSDSDNCLLVQN